MKSPTSCHVDQALQVIGGKWKLIILWHLSQGTLRFSQLEKKIPQVSQKMLSQSLRELAQDGIVNRKVFPVIPPKVEYSITKKGVSLKNVLNELDRWSQTNI